MDCQITSIILLCLLIGRAFSAPQAPPPAAGAAGAPGAGGILPIALPIHALRKWSLGFNASTA